MTFTTNRKYILALLVLSIVFGGILYATTFKYLYTTEIEIYSTDAYGGGDGDVTDTEVFTGNIDLETNGYYGIWLSLEYDTIQGSVTDNIVLSYYASFNGTTYDDTPLWSQSVTPASVADLQITFGFFPAPPHGRVGLVSTGATDDFDAQVTYHPVRGDGT